MTINWFLAESIINDRYRELRLAEARRWPEVGRAQRLAASRLATTRHDLATGSRESRRWAKVWRIATATVRPIRRSADPPDRRPGTSAGGTPAGVEAAHGGRAGLRGVC